MFWHIRILTFYALISLVMVTFFITCCIPIQLVGARYHFRYRIAEIISYIFIYLMWAICGIKFVIKGRNKIPANVKPYIALANHQSFWDNFFMQLIIPEHSWVIKKELLSIPVFGSLLKAIKPIAVDRNNTRSVVQILEEGAKKIDSGLSIVMFPESLRIKVGKTVKFKVSAAKLALNTKTPIILIAHNAGLVWPKGFWFKRSGTIKVTIIEYIPTEKILKYDARELTEYIQTKINTEKNRLADLGV